MRFDIKAGLWIKNLKLVTFKRFGKSQNMDFKKEHHRNYEQGYIDGSRAVGRVSLSYGTKLSK